MVLKTERVRPISNVYKVNNVMGTVNILLHCSVDANKRLIVFCKLNEIK